MYRFTTKDVLCLYPRNLLGCKMIHTFILSLPCNRLQLFYRLLMVATIFALSKWLPPLVNIPWTNNLPIPFHFVIVCLCYPIGDRKKACCDRLWAFLLHTISWNYFHRRIYSVVPTVKPWFANQWVGFA